MKKNIILICSILFASCGGSGIKNNMPDPNDTSGAAAQIIEISKANRDSILIDPEKSSFECTRSKMLKSVDKKMKLFGATMSVKMNNASFTANTKLQIKNACWYLSDKKFDSGKIVLDMKSVAALRIGDDEKVEIGNPGYLEAKKYPTSTLTVLSFGSIPKNPKELMVNAKLQIKDTLAEISFPAQLEFLNPVNPDVPAKLTGDFHIDGIKWKLNPTDAKVTKDDLLFHVVLITEKK